MGILDDAIREHLDLKRRRGADDSELRRLEDEAFGPPSRPGEPDFPQSGEVSHTENGEGPEAVALPTAEAPVGLEEPAGEELVAEPAGEELVAEPAPAAEAEEEFEEEEAPYEQEDDLDLDELEELDLDLDEELDDDEEWEEEPDVPDPRVPEDSATTPIEHQDTVEHTFEEGEVEEETPPSGEAGASGEDVLEETPDFLKEAPENDELWFEQGAPKDFDFDE